MYMYMYIYNICMYACVCVWKSDKLHENGLQFAFCISVLLSFRSMCVQNHVQFVERKGMAGRISLRSLAFFGQSPQWETARCKIHEAFAAVR